MSFKVASWNVETRLSETGAKLRGTPDQIVQSIKLLDADILVLLEAHKEISPESLNSYQQLNKLGYKIYNVPYDDDSALKPKAISKRFSLMLLSKLPIDEFKVIGLGDLRNALSAVARDHDNKQFRVIGLHLDDRLESIRLKQITDLVEIINRSKLPTIVMGDFNAMHGEDLWPAKFLRSKFVELLSKISPHILGRVVEMARGKTLKLLESKTNLHDVDERHRPTTTPKMMGREWVPSVRLIQIDHIFISPDIEAEKFQIAPDGGADHRSISADITIN